MKNVNELNYKDLKFSCNPDVFTFETTEELESIQEGIGQDRGIKALEFGIQVDVIRTMSGENHFFFSGNALYQFLVSRIHSDSVDKLEFHSVQFEFFQYFKGIFIACCTVAYRLTCCYKFE